MPKTILLVEDEEAIQRLCARLLGDLGHRLFMAGSVRDATERLKHSLPDLLITDLKLPDGNGMQVVREFRRRCPEGRVIVVTGSLGLEDPGPSAGDPHAHRVLHKPFDIDEFLRVVQEVLAQP